MFIDTDTTAADVYATLVDSLNRGINGINNGITTNRQHPTYMTRTMLRDKMFELKGMWSMFVEARRYECNDVDTINLAERVHAAIANVEALYPKRGTK